MTDERLAELAEDHGFADPFHASKSLLNLLRAVAAEARKEEIARTAHFLEAFLFPWLLDPTPPPGGDRRHSRHSTKRGDK